METIKHQTAIVIAEMIADGMTQLTFEAFKAEVERFGLRVNLKDYCVLKYINTANGVPYLHCTGGVVDVNGISYANSNGTWYRENVVKDTQIARDFLEFRKNNFCILPSGHIYSC